MIGAGAGATIGFVDGLISGKGLKGALNEAAQGFGTGAFSGAISGAVSGGLGAGIGKLGVSEPVKKGLTWLINTSGDTAGELYDRHFNGEKITGKDIVLAFGINAVFNDAGTKVIDKVKNSKAGQAVSGKISNVKDVIKGKVGGALSAVKDWAGSAAKEGSSLTNAGEKAVTGNCGINRYERAGYQSDGRSNNLFGRDRQTRNTVQYTEWRRSIRKNNIQVDYLGKYPIGQPSVPNIPHVHLEFLNPRKNGNGFDVIKNVHVPLVD